MVLTSVDLPWPLAPRMPMRWPAMTERLTFARMSLRLAVHAVAELASLIASIGLGRLAGSLNSKVKSASASTGAIFSMRSSALTRLCACLALVALALKRSMNFCRCAIFSFCLENAACCSSSCCARIVSNAL